MGQNAPEDLRRRSKFVKKLSTQLVNIAERSTVDNTSIGCASDIARVNAYIETGSAMGTPNARVKAPLKRSGTIEVHVDKELGDSFKLPIENVHKLEQKLAKNTSL